MVAVKRKRETHYFAEKKRHREDLVYEYAHRDDYEYYDEEDYRIITILCLKFNMLQLDDESDLSIAEDYKHKEVHHETKSAPHEDPEDDDSDDYETDSDEEEYDFYAIIRQFVAAFVYAYGKYESNSDKKPDSYENKSSSNVFLPKSAIDKHVDPKCNSAEDAIDKTKKRSSYARVNHVFKIREDAFRETEHNGKIVLSPAEKVPYWECRYLDGGITVTEAGLMTPMFLRNGHFLAWESKRTREGVKHFQRIRSAGC